MGNAGDRMRAFIISPDPSRIASDIDLDTFVDVVATTTDAEHRLVDELATASVDIVVVDMALSPDDATTAIQDAAGLGSVGVLAVTSSPLKQVVVARALGAGAHACVTRRTIAEHGSEPFEAAAELRPFLPTDELREALVAETQDALTASERESRLRNLVLGLIPLAGALTALISLLWRRYLGQIGVRPVDLAVDPTTRIADVFFTISVMVGLIGPLVFVRSWLGLIMDAVNDRTAAWMRRHLTWSRVVLAVLTLAVSIALANYGQLLFALFVGPFVGLLLLAKVFDLDDDLPAVLRITTLRSGPAAIGAVILFSLFLALLSYEVIIRGPSFGPTGESGWIAPDVLGFNAEPVEVTFVEDGSRSELLYLGGNADLYVLVDPCDDDRVDLVSVGATRITVIDRVDCTEP